MERDPVSWAEYLAVQALQVIARMMERSLEVHSSLKPLGAMLLPRACAMPEGSESAERAGKSMHGMHCGRRLEKTSSVGGRCQQCQSIRSAIAALVRMPKAPLIAAKPCVQCSAAGDAFSVEERVRSDADHALRCGRLCGDAGSWCSSSASSGG